MELVLRITAERADNSVRLILEGRLVGPWVDELQRVCGEHLAENHPMNFIIDLGSVTSMDTRGQEVLQDLVHQGAVVNCSDVLNQYLVELMTRTKRKSQGACRPCHSSEVKTNSAKRR